MQRCFALLMCAWPCAAVAGETWTPTASVAASLGPARNTPAALASWGGVAFQPAPDTLSPSLAVGAELNLLVSRSRLVLEGVPEVRLGINVLADTDYAGCLFPVLEVYALAGWRLPWARPGALRLGVGISSPWFLAGQAELGVYQLLPSMLELTVDVGEDTPALAVRAGYHF